MKVITDIVNDLRHNHELHFFSLTALELVSLEVVELLSVAALAGAAEPYVVRLSAISCLLLLVCSLTCTYLG